MHKLSKIILTSMTAIFLMASANEIDLNRMRKDAEDTVGKPLYEAKYFNSRYHSAENFSIANATLYLIGRLELKRYANKIDELRKSLEDNEFGQMIILGIWDTLTRLGKEGYISKEIELGLSSKGIQKIEAAHVILKYAPKEALSILRNSVYSSDIDEVLAAVEELAHLKDPLAYAYLSTGLKNQDEAVGFQCAMTLTRGKWKDGISILNSKFRFGNTEHRLRAAIGLSRLGDDNAIRYLIKALDSDNQQYKWCATIALGDVGSEIARVPLESFIKNERNELDSRISAMRALGNTGNTKSIPILNSFLSLYAENRLIAIAAASGLIQIIDAKKLEMIPPYLMAAW